MTTLKTEVIIVGAGPTGLSLACQLQRFGIDFLMSRKTRASQSSPKPLAFRHARWRFMNSLVWRSRRLLGARLLKSSGCWLVARCEAKFCSEITAETLATIHTC